MPLSALFFRRKNEPRVIEIVPRISDFVLSNNSSARNAGRRPTKSKLALEASTDPPHAASGAAALKVAGK